MLARARSDLVRLEPADALAAADQPRTFIVDIRPESQRRAAGEIPGAIVIERNELEWRLDPSSTARIPEADDTDLRWIVVCEGGYSSSLAADTLRRLGLRHSTDVIGGFQAWVTAGLPVQHPATPHRPRGAKERGETEGAPRRRGLISPSTDRSRRGRGISRGGNIMASVSHRTPAVGETGALRTGSALMALAGLAFIGYAVIFFIRNFTGAFLELGIGREQVAVGPDEIRAFNGDLYHYVSHLHIAVSGFIAATGLATAALAWFGVRRGMLWAYVTAVAAPVLGLAVALPAHYPWGFDTIGHLGLIYLATAVFVVGAALAFRPVLAARAPQGGQGV